MRRTKAYSTVKWRKYLDVNTNPRAKSFLESRGDDVLWQIASNIHQSATKKKSKELFMKVSLTEQMFNYILAIFTSKLYNDKVY